MIQSNPSIQMRVHAISSEASFIKSYDLRPVTDRPLPEFAAGAHIDLLLPNGMLRSYSLVNAPDERWRYVVMVSLDKTGRGGSRFIHESLRAGDVVDIHLPRNHFPLEELAPHTVLVAGGIGITPIFSMVRRLTRLGRSWHLMYCARSPGQAALLRDIASVVKEGHSSVDLRFNEEPGYDPPDFSQLVAQAPENTHFYCCGPKSLMDAFEKASSHIARERVHTESFLPVSTTSNELGGFTVVLERSGVTLYVPEGETILNAVRAAGIDAVSSCEEGTCGTCEVAVIEGIPCHRDQVLSEEEKEQGTTIMICCSGSNSERLLLDL